MKSSFLSFSIGSLVSFFGLSLIAGLIASCSHTGGGVANNTGYGPFDSRGNYVEAWADNPSKWSNRSVAQDATPDAGSEPTLLASNDAPPSNMTPVTTATSSGAVEVARMKPSSSSSATKTITSTSSKPKTTTTVAKTTPKTTPKVTAKSTTKTVSSKPRTSTASRVAVKKGDTLSGLASRYKTSVSAIQKANGMRDTKLAIGRSLVIPRM